jgi:hypothetical protein
MSTLQNTINRVSEYIKQLNELDMKNEFIPIKDIEMETEIILNQQSNSVLEADIHPEELYHRLSYINTRLEYLITRLSSIDDEHQEAEFIYNSIQETTSIIKVDLLTVLRITLQNSLKYLGESDSYNYDRLVTNEDVKRILGVIWKKRAGIVAQEFILPS